MPKNALSPANKNALAKQLDPLQELLAESAKYPQYNELVDYLTSRQMMPPIRHTFLPPGTTGEFSSPGWGSDLPAAGRLDLAYSARPSTLVHELTHAAQRQITLQYEALRDKSKTQELTPKEQQFMDAYSKLIYSSGRMFGPKSEATQRQSAERIAPAWAKEKADYRASSGELAAFGMGSTVAPNKSYPAPLHIDPTYATEFSIMLDMARRNQPPVNPGK